MRLVVDASIAVKWVVPEPGSEAANALRGDEMIAPGIWLAEAGNALWRLVQLREITADEASRRLTELRGAPVASVPLEPHVEAALKFATEIGHPIYDCLYLAVAVHHDTHVVTADHRFATAVARSAHARRVRLLGTEGRLSLHES